MRSVWVDHLRRGNDELGRLLVDEQVLGLGWVDVNLLASATLSAASFWTFDRSLMGAAKRLGLS